MSVLAGAATVFYMGWLTFLYLGCLGPHALAVPGYLLTPRVPGPRTILELIYGFINPLIYLVVFQPALFRRVTPDWLSVVCWTVFASYWGTRTFGKGRAPRAHAAAVTAAAATLITVLFVRDAWAARAGSIVSVHMLRAEALPLALVIPLYFVPLMAAVRQLDEARSEEAWATSDFFYPTPPRRLLVGVVAAIGALLLVWAPRRADADVRTLLLENRAAIADAAGAHQVDPRLLAAIVYVTQRDLNPPLRAQLEDAVSQMWLADEKGWGLVGEAFDPSLGLAQVKPMTAMAARAVVSPDEQCVWQKSSRAVVSLHGAAIEALRPIAPTNLPHVDCPERAAMTRLLHDPRRNVDEAALIIQLVERQWAATNGAANLHDRPEILATLFQLGFEHSHPNADPQPNHFGRAVGAMVDDAWITTHFGMRDAAR